MIESEPVRAERDVDNPGMETAVKIPKARDAHPKHANARALAAGTGVTSALVVAAIIAFASVAAYVGFEGMPFGSADSTDATVSFDSGAPQAAALAAARTANGVAADPARPSASARAEILAALPPGAAGGAGANGPGGLPGDPTTGGGTGPGAPTPAPEGPGPLQGTIGGVDDAAGGLGLDVPLQDLTNPITQPVDDAVGGTLNSVGNGLGAGNLGDRVNGTLGGLTNGLLGGD